MAIESTAINDLISGLQSKPLQRDSDDWLFGARDDATEIDTSRQDKATSPFDRSTPPVVPLPQPFMRQPAPAIDYALNRPSSPTTHVRPNWPSIGKKLALPIGLFSIFIVLLGVYFAKSDETKPLATKAVESKAVEPKPMKVVAAVAPAPVVVAPKVEEPKVEEPKVEEAKVEAPKVEAPKVEEPKLEAVAVPVDPGSPAGRFLAPAEPTLPTIAPKAAPAPQTVPNLAPPAVKQTATVTAVEAPAAKPIAKPVKKTVAQVRAEKRAATKRAAKASIASTKARSKKQVATAADADETPERPAAKATGKGVLSIASTPAMEVWVDGRNSKAQTPVRIILLSGKHKVTLHDTDDGMTKSFDIVIKPDETTKVVKNYQ